MNHQFYKTGNTIHVQYLLLVAEGEQMPGLMATGIIENDFIDVDGQWKLKKHHITIDPAMFNLMNQMQNK